MSIINPVINLNKHPKDCDNLSFANAVNVKIDKDNSCITNEESIANNAIINDALKNYNDFEIIPCNTELVIFAINKDNNKIDIFRYSEVSNTIYKVCSDINYHNGKIKGAFTYNVHNELIISFSEYDADELVPLRTINLGNFGNEFVVKNEHLPNSPIVNIPSFNTHEYVSGRAYKGWNYIFIRYKIDDVDYTQWYSIGHPIYVDTIENRQIIRYCFNIYKNADNNYGDDAESNFSGFSGGVDTDGNGTGCSDYLSDDTDIAKESFKIVFNNLDTNYNKYQIGIICVSKTYNKCFRTEDLDINNTDYIFNIRNVIEYGASELIIDNYNYFNVGNVINYQNRLYISNYNEQNINNDDTDILENINNITIKLNVNDFTEQKDLFVDNAFVKNKNVNPLQTDSISKYMYLNDYLGIKTDDKVTIKSIDSDNNINVICENGNAGDYYFYTDNYYHLGLYKYELSNVQVDYTHKLEITTSDDNKIEINLKGAYISNGGKYINTNINFNNHKINSTLIPGEVYNFFIHFVDKYGHSTNGYRLDNHIKWKAENNNLEIVPIKFIDRNNNTIYASVCIDDYVIKNNDLNIENLKFYSSIDYTSSPKLVGDPTGYDIAPFIEDFKKYFNSFNNTKYNNYKWYQIVEPIGEEFNVFINNNGDRLFRVPLVNDKTFNIKVSNITIPNGYIGYFISYEKFESLKRTTGLLTIADANTQDRTTKLTNPLYAEYLKNTEISNNMLFYSNYFDCNDAIKLDYDILRIEQCNSFDTEDIMTAYNILRNGSYSFMHNLNKPQIKYSYDDIRNYAMPNYKLGVANDASNGRGGVGTALIIDNKYNLFNTYTPNKDNTCAINIYLATVLNCSRNIYMSTNKTLVKLSNVIYNNDDIIITNGYNGHFTYASTLVYSMDGVSFNGADNIISRLNKNTEYNDYFSQNVSGLNILIYPFVQYIQYRVCDTIFHESRSFNNSPDNIVYYLKKVDENNDNSDNKFWLGCMVTPANSIDLFKNKQLSVDELNPKTYVNFNQDIKYLDRFDKTVRRSAVIQDESRSNAWRRFSTEDYKMLNENKGKITNIVGIGYIFLVHTEHSLFMFDINNVLKTENKDVYLNTEDVFDVAYKELLTSELGYGGLQDNESYIIGQFGYIYYDEDSNRFYRYDENNLVTIDKNIVSWLYKNKPNKVRFINDYDNNRLLIKLNIKDNYITLSYNYLINNFVSIHSYIFDKGYNTKNKLYFKLDNTNKLFNFVHNDTYGKIPDDVINTIYSNNKARIDIIINVAYEYIKYLESISYKLNKVDNSAISDLVYLPVEEHIQPFSGDRLIVYNNEVSTGLLDINIDKEEDKNVLANYTKPYWQLGNWNFSYLRNKADLYNYGKGFYMSRLYGNYFIVGFIFDNEDGNKVEFESIDFKIVNAII